MFKTELDYFYEKSFNDIQDAINRNDTEKLSLLAEWDEYSLFGFR